MAPSKYAGILRWLGAALAVLALALFAYRVRRAFIPFFFAIGIGYIISPLVRMAERRGAPRAAAIFTAYVLVAAVIGFSLAFVLPPLATQLDEIVGVFAPDASADGLAADWRRRLQLLPEGAASRLATVAVDRAEAYISEVARAAGRAVSALTSQLVNIVLAPVIAFYLTRDVDAIRERFASWLPAVSRNRIMSVVSDIDRALAGWVRGQVIVCTFVGVATGISLGLLGVRYALPIGFLTGILEIIPYFGPVLALIPAVLLAAQKSTLTALFAATVFVGIQQVESAVVSPKIVGDCVGLHPLVVIGALLIGGTLFGVIGMLLAVPVTAVLFILGQRLLVDPAR